MTVDEPLVLAFGGDDRFAMPLTVAAFSALSNLPSGTRVDLYVLDGGISESHKQRIESILCEGMSGTSLHWLRPDLAQYEAFRIRKGVTRAAYMRLSLPELVPQDRGKVIYLDGDVVVAGNLVDLWQQPIEGQSLLAVQAFFSQWASSPVSSLLTTYQDLGLHSQAPLFSSGVMVLNLERLRSTHSFGLVLECLGQYRHRFRYCDNDGLNAVFAEDWGHLDILWNVQLGAMRHPELMPASPLTERIRASLDCIRQEAKILHYTHSPKPWQARLPGHHHGSWFRHLRASGWFSPIGFHFFHLRCILCGLGYGAEMLARRALRAVQALWPRRRPEWPCDPV